jgi:hypothetical protein
MNEKTPPKHEIGDEFREIGENLIGIIHSTWNSPERKSLTQEIESGLLEMGALIRDELEKFELSSTGQQLKSDVDDLRDRIRSGEIEQKIRSDLVNALQLVNNELKRVNEQLNRHENPPQADVDKDSDIASG